MLYLSYKIEHLSKYYVSQIGTCGINEENIFSCLLLLLQKFSHYSSLYEPFTIAKHFLLHKLNQLWTLSTNMYVAEVRSKASMVNFVQNLDATLRAV